MPEKPTTLLERLNQVLESLALKIGAGGSGGGLSNVPGGTPSSGEAEGKTFLGGLKSLFDNFLNRIGRELKEGTKGSGGGAGSPPRTFPPTTSSSSPSKGVPSPSIPFMDKYDRSRPLDVIPVQNSVPRERKSGEKQDLAGAMNSAAGLFGGAESKTGQSAGSKVSEAADIAQLAGRAAAGDPTAMIGLADKAVKQVEEKIAAAGKIGSSLAGTLSKEGPGDVAGGVFEAGEHVGEMIGGPIGEAVTQVSAFHKMVAESVDNLRRFDREIITASFRFGEFSAAMAAVEGQQEVRDIDIGMRKGDAQADSTAKLAEAMSELNETVLPFENQFANFRNEVLTTVTKLATEFIKATKILEVMKILLEILSKTKADEDDDPDKEIVLERLYKAGDKYARPDRFPE